MDGLGPAIAGLVVSLIAYMGLVGVYIANGTLTHAAVPQSIAWIGLAFVAYLGMVVWGERARRVDTRLIWAGAVVFRLLLLLTTPTLSDDVYRYLWDGYVANNGVSPYALPVDSSQLDALNIPLRSLVNHSWMASPYLPAAQWLFAGVTGLAPLRPLSMQVAMVAIDLLNGALIVALLIAARLPGRRVLIYLLNPLAVVESAHGAHVDVWMIFLTLLAVWLALGRRSDEGRRSGFSKEVRLLTKAGLLRPGLLGRYNFLPKIDAVARMWLAPIALGLATLTKILPVLLLPIFFWPWRWRRLLLYAVTVGVPIALAGSRAGWGLTGPLDGRGFFAALRIYGDRWNFNSGLFHWLETALTQSRLLNLDPASAGQVAKSIVALSMMAVLLAVWMRARHTRQTRARIRLMAVPLMAYVLLAPTMHPWYLLFLLAFTPFLAPGADEWWGGWWAVAPWLYLSGALFLSYLTYVNPLDLREFEWVRRVEWIPALALLVAGGVSLLLRNSRSTHDS